VIPEYVRAYQELYRSHWWWRAREEFIVDLLRTLPGDAGGRRILDVGCGGGLLFDRLSALGSVWGVEPDASFRSGQRERDERIYWGPLETFVPERTFDLILMLDVLEHIRDAEGALGRLLACLDERGLLVLTVPAFPALWTRHDDINGHVVRYTKRSFRDLAARAGCRVEALRYFFHWTGLAKLGVRALERVRGVGELTEAVPRVPPSPVNRILYGLSRLEQRAGAHRLLPFGSSLLALCRHQPLAGRRAAGGEPLVASRGGVT
jgi:SAM-dependent methyltransferase